MATLTLKNIPDDLYNDLKRHAKLHHRSLNKDVIVSLEHVLYSKRMQKNAMLRSAREVRRDITGLYVTDEDISKFKEEGRP